ncbi:hypothetical protein ACET3X_003323 [Alternaria dauci]|uniref:Uncharacterized protein n=1 Tax=Alternaria dauci TaxID=48095 RepID=A0ABR3US58_9PLEO
MASNNDDNRRHHTRPEDNPFIAFRRFADSQVSSLLNTVFTLPATIANYNNAHLAREQCLFGKADEKQCAKLRDIEADIAELRNEGRELFRVGDVQAVLRNSETLMQLDRRADDVRREILGAATKSDELQVVRRNDAGLIEKVANEKGQEWGWSWDWGFPRPFDTDDKGSPAATDEEGAGDWMQLEKLLRLQAEARRLADEFNDKAWDDPVADVAKFTNHSESRPHDSKPRVWTWSKSWQWPPPTDASQIHDAAYSPRALEQSREMNKAGVPWQAAYEDLLRAEQAESPHCMRGHEPKAWDRRKMPLPQEPNEALQDASEPTCPAGTDADASDNYWVHGKILITQHQLQETVDRGEQPSCPHFAAFDEPSYEYSHDHEDQHDDPPTPKQDRFPFADTVRRDTYNTVLDAAHERDEEDAETEMDAYERMDAVSRGPASAPGHMSVSSTIAEQITEAKPSILSTLTTTERTVASDGSITTKVVLKKRFADGREESSETVHTQRGQGHDEPQRDPWRAFHDTQSAQAEPKNAERKKSSGWFWSS